MIVVSLDMFLNSTQDTFVKHRNDKFCLVKGYRNSGKTISIIFKALYLKRNYCFFESEDKILFLTLNSEVKKVIDIFNYISRSDLYKSIIPSEDIEVHILTYDDLSSLKMDKVYTHIIVDNIESLNLDQIKYIMLKFKNLSYSKVYFIQNSIENLESVNLLVGYCRKVIGVRESIFKFRYVIENSERDEFTQIGITPDVKYLNYEFREFVDFFTKKIIPFYVKDKEVYVDKGSFLHNVSYKSLIIPFLDENLNYKDESRILSSWVDKDRDLYFVEIDDEGMGGEDLFRGDIVLIDKSCRIENEDVVIIIKNKHMYARKFIREENGIKFVSSEKIFKDIILDRSVKILGKVIAYVRLY